MGTHQADEPDGAAGGDSAPGQHRDGDQSDGAGSDDVGGEVIAEAQGVEGRSVGHGEDQADHGERGQPQYDIPGSARHRADGPEPVGVESLMVKDQDARRDRAQPGVNGDTCQNEGELGGSGAES